MTDWQQALSAQIAQNIEHYRLRGGLRRVDLAARCTALGLPTKRPALAALLDGHRQTVTVQELVVLAEALEVTVAQLIVPLHTGEPALSAPGRVEHALSAAERLFGPSDGGAPTSPTRPFNRFRQDAQRFERINRRLAELGHALAIGAITPREIGGQPHPAAEILRVEAALARLISSRQHLRDLALTPTPLTGDWSFLDDEHPPVHLPILDLLGDDLQRLLPLMRYRLHVDSLPTAALIETWPNRRDAAQS